MLPLSVTLRGPVPTWCSSVPEASRPRLSSPLARSHTERSRSAGKPAALLATRIAHSMLRSRDLAPRRRMFCGASKAGFSNDDGSSAMIADITLNATSWRRTGRSPTAVRSSQSLPHALFSTRGLFACSALNARSNDCHVGLLCMTQRAQYRKYTWACTLCVVLRTDFSCCPDHFQATKLNCCERCSRVPVGAVSRSSQGGPATRV